MSRQAIQSVAPPAQEVPIVRSQHLDASLEKAHRLAMSQHHAGVSLEHLLFALTEDPEALLVLGASTVDVERLRADITTHLGQLPNDQPSGKAILPTNDLLKVLKLAATAAQQSARRQMDGAIVMAAIIGDASTPSAGMLRAHGLNFQEVIRVLQRSATPAAAPRAATVETPPAPPAAAQPAPKIAAPAPVAEPTPQPASPAPAAEASKPIAQAPPPAAKESQPEQLQPAQPQEQSETASGLKPTTEELLASVRARLQGTAPPPPRKTEPAPLGEPDKSDPPTIAIPREQPAVDAKTAARAAAAVLSAAPPQPTPAAPAPAPVQAAPSTPAAAPTSPPPEIRLEWPRTPADLVPPPATKQPPLPWPSSAAATSPPHAPVEASQPVAALRHVAEPTLQPPLPLVPASAQRSGPPPLPLPTVSNVQTPPAAPPKLPPAQPAVPPALPPSPSLAAGRESQRPPPIPPPTMDLRALVQTLPRRLREGQTDIIEIVVPRRTLEIPPAAGHRWPPIRVATLRLKTDPEGAHIELASPESLWISPPRVHQGADDAIWRWRVTPRNKGRIRLSLAAATRIVGSEGISAEVPLGEENIDVDVAKRGSRRGFVGLLLFGNLLAIGFLAMVLSGRATQIAMTVLKSIRSLIGG